MTLLDNALLVDTHGNTLTRVKKFVSRDLDELAEWSRKIYAPTEINMIPLDGICDARCRAITLGRMTISRNEYGAALKVTNPGSNVAQTVVATTIRGEAQHRSGDIQQALRAGPGEAFVIRGSEFGHFADLSADCIRLAITLEPDILNEVSIDWFGTSLEENPLPHLAKIGGEGTGWQALLHYIVSLINEAPDRLSLDRLGRHLENVVCRHILSEVYNSAGTDLGASSHAIAPRVIRRAEAYMIEHAADVPKLEEIARVANTSVRNLSQNFKEFRGYTVTQFLSEQRLTAVRRELLSNGGDRKISDIARHYGFVHMGEFAKKYRKRFGELPSDTLKI